MGVEGRNVKEHATIGETRRGECCGIRGFVDESENEKMKGKAKRESETGR